MSAKININYRQKLVILYLCASKQKKNKGQLYITAS